jgi:hypothetical protein
MTQTKRRGRTALIDARISRLYTQHCSGVQIDVMDIGKVFEEGQRWLAGNPGITDDALAAAIVAFVDTIRKN